MAVHSMSSRKRILLSEGSSLSSREAVTAGALGIAGHQYRALRSQSVVSRTFLTICHSFSYQCPPIGKDPAEYTWMRCWISSPVAIGTVLFPTHEQAFLFSRERAHLRQELDSPSQISPLSFRFKERLPSSGLLNAYPYRNRLRV